MAKGSRKKPSKKRLRRSWEDKPAVVSEQQEEEEESLHGAEEDISSEEEQEEDGDERKRQKLLEAISALGGKRKKTLAERSEAAVHMSEFTVDAAGEDDRIQLSDLIGTLQKTPGLSGKTKKRLKNLERSKKTIECPLSKQESERIRRDLAFRKASEEVSRWKSVITQNQKAEQLVFPLSQEPSGPRPVEKVVVGWKAHTPLEKEVFSLLSANKQPINDPVLTPVEEASLKAMSLEEAKIRRAELQKARALQSFYEAKARRQKKIKSKKYHKVQNKAKRKEFLKQFDEMVKKDPAAALEELNKMELARMQERMSLKHQNSGKWAKSKVIMARYDEGARKAMQEQLEVNKDLTQKLVTSLNNEEEEEEEAGDTEVLPDFVNDAEGGLDSLNPWMRGKLSEAPAENETVAVTAGVQGNTAEEEEEEEEEEEVEETEEEVLLREFASRRKQRQTQDADTAEAVMRVEEDDDDEEEELSEFKNLLRARAEGGVGAASDAGSIDTSAQLEEGLLRIRSLEDVELLTQEEEVEEATDEALVEPQQPPPTESLPSATQSSSRKRKKGIELTEVLTKNTEVIPVPLAPTVEEDSEDPEEMLSQRGLIKEAFAGDDVISDFLQEKSKQEDATKPKVVDLTLPGWGEWGGEGLKPSRSKRKRFRINMAPPPPRKDQHLPGVIISEKRNSSVTLHQVNTLPFPFDNPTVFENIIHAPLGRTWNTECTVKKITKPKVVTKLGAIIEPMTREELVKDKKQPSVESSSSSSSVKRKV